MYIYTCNRIILVLQSAWKFKTLVQEYDPVHLLLKKIIILASKSTLNFQICTMFCVRVSWTVHGWVANTLLDYRDYTRTDSPLFPFLYTAEFSIEAPWILLSMLPRILDWSPKIDVVSVAYVLKSLDGAYPHHDPLYIVRISLIKSIKH